MKKKINKPLLRYINKIYNIASHPYTAIATLALIALWFVVGIKMHYDEVWYKTLHLFEVLITLILVFIIEVTQRAEMKALQEKLDEIIKKLPGTDRKKTKIEQKYKGEV